MRMMMGWMRVIKGDGWSCEMLGVVWRSRVELGGVG